MLSRDELIKRLQALPDLPVKAEFADMGEGGNTTSEIKDIVVEDGQIILVTDHAA